MIRFLCSHSMRAVPVVAAGMALWLLTFGCQIKPPPKEPAPPLKPPHEEAFEQALKYEHLGEYQRAYEAYVAYVEDYPSGEYARLALYNMGRIRYGDRRFREALAIFERVSQEYPSHPEQPGVEFDILSTLYRLGEFEQCLHRGDAWLESHPGHPLEGDVLYLLGKCAADSGRTLQAFSWWILAAERFRDSLEKLAVLDDMVLDLIDRASLNELEVLAAMREDNPFLPAIFHRTAALHEEQGDLLQARKTAMALHEMTSSAAWRLKANRILTRIDEALSVRTRRIGCLLPLSGPFAIYGREVLKGIQLGAAPWFSGPGDPEIELLIRDTQGDPEVSVRALEELAQEERVIAVIGPLSSRAAEASAARAQELGVPIITMAQREGLPATGDMVFRNFMTPSMEVKAILDHAFFQKGIQRFGILYPDNPYGRHLMNLFWDRVDDLGGEIAAVEAYPPDKTDFSDEIKKMVGLYYPRPASVVRMLEQMRIESGVTAAVSDDEPPPIVDFDAVFLPDSIDRVALVAPQFPFHRVLDLQLLGTSLWQSADLIDLTGDYVQNAIIPSGFFPDSGTEAATTFQDRFRESFEEDPDKLSATGYDTMQYLKKVLSDNRILSREDLKRALWESEGMTGATGEIRFDREGEILRDPLLLTVRGRRFVPVVREDPYWWGYPDLLP